VRLQLSTRQGRRKHAAQHAAFADLHREHAVGIYNLAIRLVGDREDARDITQEVLLKAFERLGKPGELNQRAWLYRVTVNACYDHLRAQSRRPRSVNEGRETASNVDAFEQAELIRTVDAALRRLPPAQRAALLLREVHGLPTRDVAFALGTQSDSAAVTLSRARRAFCRHFVALRGPDAGPAPAVTWRATDPPGIRAEAGAVVLGLWLPRLHLAQMPLPVELESARMLSAASTTLSMSAAHSGEATVGVIARIADLLCTKAGAVGASATLLTGSIGGALAVDNAHRNTRPTPVAASSQTTTPVKVTAGAPPSPEPRQAAPSASPTSSPTPSSTPSSAAPSATPSATATPLTLGEASPTTTPSPEPSPTEGPSATPTPTPTPTTSGAPAPSPSPTPQSSPAP
jgi:RNA polymerase sigma-70 factor (ECF subfamily)